MAGTQDRGMGLQSQPAYQGCMQVSPDRIHQNGELYSARVAVPSASPAGLVRYICAGGDCQIFPPSTPASAECAARELPAPTFLSGSTTSVYRRTARESGRVVTPPMPTRLLLRKHWQSCLLLEPRQPSTRSPVPRALAVMPDTLNGTVRKNS